VIEAGAPQKSRLGRALVTIAVVGMVSMWVYVLYLAFGPGRADSPDRLDDPAFAVAAQARCDRALDRISELQPASEAPDARTRAGTLDEANDALADMLADLRAIVPGGEDGVLVGRWLTDWDTYLQDRRDYADALRRDPDARLLVSPKKGQQVTEFLDQFAKDNTMPACSTPGDAG
jgi:hypothetical protein